MSESTDAAAAAAGRTDPAGQIAAGYAFTGPALDLGALLWDGACLPDRQIRIPLAMPNRHGLVAGATGTGTGKTKTLQLVAEQLSAHGVPVFLADIKGDVSGTTAPGTPGERIDERAREVAQNWEPAGFPGEFYSLGGIGPGIPVRSTVTAFGRCVAELAEHGRHVLGGLVHEEDADALGPDQPGTQLGREISRSVFGTARRRR